MMCYVDTYFTFVMITIYIRLTMCSTTLVSPFPHVIVPIWLSFYEFIKKAMLICLFVSHFSTFLTSSWHIYPLWLTFCSALMPIRIFWLSSTPNCIPHFHSNLYKPTILNTSKIVFIPASFLQLELLGGLFVLFFFITKVTSCFLCYISPIALLDTISFLVGFCEPLGDVGVSFSTHLLHLYWVET